MTSQRQVDANRRNAQLSTGPKRDEGKEISRLNALKHGMTAETIIIEGEEPAEFDALRAKLFHDFNPCSALEVELTQRLAGLLWRLRRIPAFEAALFEFQRTKFVDSRDNADDPARSPWIKIAESYGMALRQTQPEVSPAADKPDPVELSEQVGEEKKGEDTGRKKFAQLGQSLAGNAQILDAFGKLTRYETGLARAVERTIQQLERLDEKRSDKTILNGKVIEIGSEQATD